MASFNGSIDTTRVSWAYRSGLFVVTLAMLLLPLVYLSVIVLAGASVWWHLTRHTWWLQGGGGIQWRLIAYAAPAFAGTVVTFFMVKPVFARRPRRRDPLVLRPADHPPLFAFIEQICRQVRAPIPRRVQVDCQVNASASFAPGWQSLLRRDLVLTIGLPLAPALSVRELGGVLAHEFGHFAQGSGLRLTMVVRGINAWFSRVVYERDSWDWRLDEWTKQGDVRVALLLLPSHAGVWLSRQVLKFLMLGGHVISCFLMRQMEYDADSYEVKIAGSDAFARTMTRLRELNLAAFHSAAYVQSEFSARRLPADLPLFLVTWQRTRPAEASEPPDEPPSKRTTGLFSTHPTDEDRLSAAARAADRGILIGGNEPATELFTDFEKLSRAATKHHYEDRGVLDDVSLVDSVNAVYASVGREERQRALSALFDLGISRFRALRVPARGSEPPAKIETWRFPDALERFDDRVRQRAKAFVAREVLRGGYTVDNPGQFELSEWTLEAAEASGREAIERMDVLQPILEPYERARMLRVAHGLERVAQSRHPRCSPTSVHEIVQALNTMASAMDVLLDLAPVSDAHLLLTEMQPSSPRPEMTRARLDRLTAVIDESMARLRHLLGGVPCPALMNLPEATLEQACKLTANGGGNRFDVITAVETLYRNLLLECCWLAARDEAAN